MSITSISRRTWRRVFVVATSLVLIGLASLPGPTISSAAVAEQVSQPKPTIVLVHGAQADSSSWSAVAQSLQSAGYTVDVFPNPLRGVSSDSAYLADFLRSITGPIVLVGHSYGGIVTTNAALNNPNVKALVYVDAFIPDQGETLQGLVSARPGSCLEGNSATVFKQVPYPGGPVGDVDLYVPPNVFLGCFANDLPASTGAVLASTQRPLANSANLEPSGAPAWKTIPSWALVGTIDQVIPPAELLFMAQRAQAHIVQVHAGHLPMISQPATVTNLIVTAANATAH
jgi:pimeloyl-ACP methyl ester carboxylesterase